MYEPRSKGPSLCKKLETSYGDRPRVFQLTESSSESSEDTKNIKNYRKASTEIAKKDRIDRQEKKNSRKMQKRRSLSPVTSESSSIEDDFKTKVLKKPINRRNSPPQMQSSSEEEKFEIKKKQPIRENINEKNPILQKNKIEPLQRKIVEKSEEEEENFSKKRKEKINTQKNVRDSQEEVIAKSNKRIAMYKASEKRRDLEDVKNQDSPANKKKNLINNQSNHLKQAKLSKFVRHPNYHMSDADADADAEAGSGSYDSDIVENFHVSVTKTKRTVQQPIIQSQTKKNLKAPRTVSPKNNPLLIKLFKGAI